MAYFSSNSFYIKFNGWKDLDSNRTIGEKAQQEQHKDADAVLKKSCKQYPIKLLLYSHLPPIIQTAQVRQARHAGNC